MKKLMICMSLFFIVSMAIADSRVQDQASRDNEYRKYFDTAVEYWMKEEFFKSVDFCKKALQLKPDSALARAFICLNYYEIAELLKNDGERIEYYNSIIQLANEGIQKDPKCAECYFMRGVGTGRKATTSGVMASLYWAGDIEKDWLECIRLGSHFTAPNGENFVAYAYSCLGIFYRFCPTFFMVKLLYGVGGDLDRSVEFCKKAYEIDPRNIPFAKEYAIALITRGLDDNNQKEIEHGKNIFKKALTLPARRKREQMDLEHCKMLLANPNLCPGYSRDKQQDVSEEAVKRNTKK